MSAGSRLIRVESPSGERFEADIPCDADMLVQDLAMQFYENQNWPTGDTSGNRSRVVVELVNPKNPDEAKRLRPDSTICEELNDNDLVRVYPEAIAGRGDDRLHMEALYKDHNVMQGLVRANPNIEFEANASQAPNLYRLTFRCETFISAPNGNDCPKTGYEHRLEIRLEASYPRNPPRVTWKTPIFHPNINDTHGAVCLGALGKDYKPDVGMGKLVTMLYDMAQYRNYDVTNAFNPDAAQWASNTENWACIEAIGGYPFQGLGAVSALLNSADAAAKPRITFNAIGTTG